MTDCTSPRLDASRSTNSSSWKLSTTILLTPYSNASEISASLFAPGYTMASVLANEFTEATGEIYLSALMEIALILFGITIVVNVLAQLLVWRVGRSARTA